VNEYAVTERRKRRAIAVEGAVQLCLCGQFVVDSAKRRCVLSAGGSVCGGQTSVGVSVALESVSGSRLCRDGGRLGGAKVLSLLV
jgi:hypothetical protein